MKDVSLRPSSRERVCSPFRFHTLVSISVTLSASEGGDSVSWKDGERRRELGGREGKKVRMTARGDKKMIRTFPFKVETKLKRQKDSESQTKSLD